MSKLLIIVKPCILSTGGHLLRRNDSAVGLDTWRHGRGLLAVQHLQHDGVGRRRRSMGRRDCSREHHHHSHHDGYGVGRVSFRALPPGGLPSGDGDLRLAREPRGRERHLARQVSDGRQLLRRDHHGRRVSVCRMGQLFLLRRARRRQHRMPAARPMSAVTYMRESTAHSRRDQSTYIYYYNDSRAIFLSM